VVRKTPAPFQLHKNGTKAKFIRSLAAFFFLLLPLTKQFALPATNLN
jgi:hypothetical protein